MGSSSGRSTERPFCKGKDEYIEKSLQAYNCLVFYGINKGYFLRRNTFPVLKAGLLICRAVCRRGGKIKSSVTHKRCFFRKKKTTVGPKAVQCWRKGNLFPAKQNKAGPKGDNFPARANTVEANGNNFLPKGSSAGAKVDNFPGNGDTVDLKGNRICLNRDYFPAGGNSVGGTANGFCGWETALAQPTTGMKKGFCMVRPSRCCCWWAKHTNHASTPTKAKLE